MIDWSARLFVVAYFVAEGSRWMYGQTPPRRAEVLADWAAVVLLTVHVAAAFHLEHHWSHAAAYRHTAEQTRAVTGLHWGGGLYANYVFLGVLVLDAAIRSRSFQRDRPVPLGYDMTVRAFLAFIVLNATVVFGPVGWIPVTILAVALVCRLKVMQQRKQDGDLSR